MTRFSRVSLEIGENDTANECSRFPGKRNGLSAIDTMSASSTTKLLSDEIILISLEPEDTRHASICE
jgi:hypothetical protein